MYSHDYAQICPNRVNELGLTPPSPPPQHPPPHHGWTMSAFSYMRASLWNGLNEGRNDEEYRNISLKADVSLSLIGREKRSRVLS